MPRSKRYARVTPAAASAVVAQEVKSLSSATQSATEEIGRKIDKLQQDAQESITAVNRIMTAIAAIRPVFSAIASAIEEQIATQAPSCRAARRMPHASSPR